MLADVERIPHGARMFLSAFWVEHPKLRRSCIKKYGYDPLINDFAYFRHGLNEHEHKSILKQLNNNRGVFSLQLAKKWAKSELNADKKSRSRRRKSTSPRLSPRRLSGGYKGINPETGGFMQYLFSLPTSFAASVDRSGSMIASAFKTS
jgi:hypothetical protein